MGEFLGLFRVLELDHNHNLPAPMGDNRNRLLFLDLLADRLILIALEHVDILVTGDSLDLSQDRIEGGLGGLDYLGILVFDFNFNPCFFHWVFP